MTQMMIKSPSAANGMKLVFTNPLAGQSITVPITQYDRTSTIENVYDFVVDWGDGTSNHITAWNDINKTHTYPNAGTYTVSINGTCERILMYLATSPSRLDEVSQWGDIGLNTLYAAFISQPNVIITATDIPNLANVTDMERVFEGCEAVNGGLENWDVSTITNMKGIFWQAYAFNGDLSNWDVSNVTNMIETFYSANAFNQDIGGWDVSNVTTMARMFGSYAGSVFNQNISTWDVSGVTDMYKMFWEANLFNQDISGWVTSSVTNIWGMFGTTRSHAFNQDVGGWDISGVTSLRTMFWNAVDFNQDLSLWDVSGVTSMHSMFFGCSSFNQDLSSWDVSGLAVSGLYHFLEDCTSYTTANYDLLLNAWSLLTLTPGQYIDVYPCYTAEAAHDILSGSPNNWIFTDGGVCP